MRHVLFYLILFLIENWIIWWMRNTINSSTKIQNSIFKKSKIFLVVITIGCAKRVIWIILYNVWITLFRTRLIKPFQNYNNFLRFQLLYNDKYWLVFFPKKVTDHFNGDWSLFLAVQMYRKKLIFISVLY